MTTLLYNNGECTLPITRNFIKSKLIIQHFRKLSRNSYAKYGERCQLFFLTFVVVEDHICTVRFAIFNPVYALAESGYGRPPHRGGADRCICAETSIFCCLLIRREGQHTLHQKAKAEHHEGTDRTDRQPDRDGQIERSESSTRLPVTLLARILEEEKFSTFFADELGWLRVRLPVK